MSFRARRDSRVSSKEAANVRACPSAVAATLLVLLFARAFGRSLGRDAALVAGLTLPATVLWLDRVPSAEIDMVQVAWVGAALLSFLRALELAEGHATSNASKVET